ncbi:hypothetical protein OQA88_7856 [Cercophora sp. LCS_1]
MSRFISAGAIDATTGESTAVPEPKETTTKKSREWAEVQAQLEAAKSARAAAAASGGAAVGQNGEKSLYEVLQANKAAKQAAFEEANRIKNQFRALDDDEIDFLEGVRETKREEEERAKREVEEGLRAFREGQVRKGQGQGEDGDGSEDEVERVGVDEVGWDVVGRKRRRRGDGDKGRKRVRGLKRRSEGDGDGERKSGEKGKGVGGDGVKGVGVKASVGGVKKGEDGKPPSAGKAKGSLVAYGSSDEDD